MKRLLVLVLLTLGLLTTVPLMAEPICVNQWSNNDCGWAWSDWYDLGSNQYLYATVGAMETQEGYGGSITWSIQCPFPLQMKFITGNSGMYGAYGVQFRTKYPETHPSIEVYIAGEFYYSPGYITAETASGLEEALCSFGYDHEP